jgi:hypothetical protein
MSYATLKDNFTMNIQVVQPPSIYVYKNNPLTSTNIIASNVAGIDKTVAPKVKNDIYDKPYEYVYQSCCSIITPSSSEYKQTREVIFSP